MAKGLYLGCEFHGVGDALGAPVMLDARDLLTHGLIVGMTGSGKTGLGIVLIEEVLRSGVPVVAIDPKGDLGNLLLLFDDFSGRDHEGWIPLEQARRAGKSVRDLAAEVAASWKRGISEWGMDEADVRGLRETHDAVILTPGSRAGIPLNIMSSLARPAGGTQDPDAYRDEVVGLATGLLRLIGRDADPFERDAVFLGHVIDSAWQRGALISLAGLVELIARPPMEKLGALPLETVYPTGEREALMLDVNNLLAAPGFDAWTTGAPLDIDQLLWSPEGRPRLSIVCTAHLAEAEREFVTALLLNKLKTWMRRQPGTGDLRMLLYIDEIVGYVPPHPASPPTKMPLLTLLKQARSQGVGVVLATQNPVDLDYKGLSNIGTWIVGRLQTDQDLDRLRYGLQGAGGDARRVEELLAKVQKRVFLLHDVHRAEPSLLRSRHTLSFLRGPLTRDDIARLTTDREGPRGPLASGAPSADAGLPVLPAPWKHHFFSRDGAEAAEPYLFVQYIARYKDAGEVPGLRAFRIPAQSASAFLEDDLIEVAKEELKSEAPSGVRYSDIPSWLASLGARGVERLLRERLPARLTLDLLADPLTKLRSRPGESRGAFEARVVRMSHDHPRARKLRERIERKRLDIESREEDLTSRRTEKWLAVGVAVIKGLGILTGRRRRLSGASAVLSKDRMENSAEARVAVAEAELRELEAELAEIENVGAGRLVEERVEPGRSGLRILRYDILWVY